MDNSLICQQVKRVHYSARSHDPLRRYMLYNVHTACASTQNTWAESKRKEKYMTVKKLIPLLFVCAASLPAQNVPAIATQRIQKEVRHELMLLPFLGVFDNLEYRVDGYNVTLLGPVTRPVLKTDADKAVKSIEGVEKVDNEIEVLPLSPNDDRLRLALYRAIYGNSVLSRYAMQTIAPIRIVVKNGNVALEGVVAMEMEKNVANIQANGVSGVFKVTNNLRVEEAARK